MGFSGGPNQCMHGWAVEAACQLLGPHSNWQEDVTTVGKLLRQDQSPTIVEDAIVPMEHLWCSPMVPRSRGVFTCNDNISLLFSSRRTYILAGFSRTPPLLFSLQMDQPLLANLHIDPTTSNHESTICIHIKKEDV
jgi:hypothetical protein